MAEKPKARKETEGDKSRLPAGIEEKVMVIPLKKQAMKSPRNYRMNRSVREIRLFLSRHMRTQPSSVFISQQLNESLWKGGIHNPPTKIKVRVSADEEGKVFARLLDEKERPQKKARKKAGGLRDRLRRKASETPSSESAGKAAQREGGKPESKPPQPTEKPVPVPEKPADKPVPSRERKPEAPEQDAEQGAPPEA